MPSEGYNRTGEKDLYENSKLIIYTFKIVFLQSQTLDIHMLGKKNPIRQNNTNQYTKHTIQHIGSRSTSSSGRSPVIYPVCQCTYVPTNILHVVASHGHDNVLFVALPRLLQEHLEDLALYVVWELGTRVASANKILSKTMLVVCQLFCGNSTLITCWSSDHAELSYQSGAQLLGQTNALERNHIRGNLPVYHLLPSCPQARRRPATKNIATIKHIIQQQK